MRRPFASNTLQGLPKLYVLFEGKGKYSSLQLKPTAKVQTTHILVADECLR
jgi:hypothetical protein